MNRNADFFEAALEPEGNAPVASPNPYWQGHRIIDRDDLFPMGFSQVELDATYASLANDSHDLGLLLESPSLDELDYYNPGQDEVEEDYVLEAITIEHFSRTERRMAAVVRTLNRHLSNSEITALSPVVGKPKKSGSFAYVIVQLPFSDGQTVNVVFHSPEGDKKRIGPSDAIIAFRWLLNKRDITHVVAPEDGEEVSLETIAKRITQLVVKNSARFERQQKAAQAERKELDDVREAVKSAEERQSDLMDKISSRVKEAESIEARLSNTLSLLEKQKTINAELQAKIDALRKARGGGNPALGTNGAGQTSGQTGQGGQEGKWAQRESTAKDIDVFFDGYQSGKYEQNPYLLTSDRSDAFVLGVWAKQNGKLPPKKIKKSRGLTWKVDDSVYIVDEKDVTLKSGPGMASGSPTGIGGQTETGGNQTVDEVVAKVNDPELGHKLNRGITDELKEIGDENARETRKELLRHVDDEEIEPAKLETLRETRIAIPGRSQAEDARYELVEADDVQASHLPEAGFQKNPAYGLENERRYHDEPASQAKVLRNAADLNPDFLLRDSVDANNGAPVIDQDNNVLGGNGRAMSVRMAYQAGGKKSEEYRAALKKRTRELGINPEKVDSMKRPMLVRRIASAYSKRERQELISSLNDTFTDTKNTRMAGKSRGDRLGKRSLSMLAEGLQEADSLREFFDRADSAAVVEQLIADGVLQQTERNAYVGPDGLLNPDGKRVVEEALRGRIASNYEALARIPGDIVAKLDAIAPSILIAEMVGGDWNLTRHIRDAIDLLAEYKSSPFSKKDDFHLFLKNVGMLDSKAPLDRYSKTAVQLFILMLESKKKALVTRFRKYAADAQHLSAESNAFHGVTKTAGQSAKENLGIDLDATHSGSGGSQPPAQGAQHAPDGAVDKDGVYIKHDGWWYTRGKDGQAKDRLGVSYQDNLEKEWRDSQGKAAEEGSPTVPSFVNDLQDIIVGRYDTDTEKVLTLLEAAIAAAERDGSLEKYEAMLEEASDHLTDLLAKEAA